MYSLLMLNMIWPFVMILVGYILKRHPVSDMKSQNGYNTPTSRKSQGHWDYAQSIAPDIYVALGIICAVAEIIVSVICAMILYASLFYSIIAGMLIGVGFLILGFYIVDKKIEDKFKDCLNPEDKRRILKKRILGVIVIVLLLLIIGIIWYKSPVNFMALDFNDVAEITIFDGTSGEAVNICGEDEIEHIINNLNSVKVERGDLSLGEKGYCFRFTIRLEEYAETVGWTSFIINSNDTIRRDPFFYNVTRGNVDLEYIQSLFDEDLKEMNTQVVSPEEKFVLTDSGKEFLQRMCLCVPEFDSETDKDTQFWRDFMFYSFTGMFDESVEQVKVYREGLGFEEPQAKVSLEQMEEYAKLTFGVASPDLKPKFEELGEKETAFYFEDGFYYIGCSDFPNYSFTYKDCTVVDEPEETSVIVDYDITFEGEENYGTVTFTLSPEDNENGFIILSKTWELDLQGTSDDTLNPEDEEKVYEIYNSTWTEEDILNALGERHPFYVSSAYYPEMINYWENVRGVRDISSLMVPLYETDEKYYTKEDFADEPELVIHLAKNEIYARHGYIFKDEDIYNYFMGCIWYGPTCAPEEFDDAVFNEFEKKNLELLASLDR